MSTWAGIVRVSHMGERKAGADDFHADREQVDAIKGAIPRGGRLHLLPAELDVSGGLPLERRPSLLAAVEGVERGEYDGVIVAYLSRFGRSVQEQLRAWDRIEAAGGRVIVVQEGIDSSTPSGRLHRNVLLSIAQHEREQHVERFDNLKRWATEAGIWQRRQTPLGYTRDEQTRRLVVNERADDVRWAFHSAAAGVPLTRISARLGMTPTGARYLLRNRVYLGELREGRYVNPSAHPALVDPDLFESVQVTRPRPPRSTRTTALLAGLVRCAGCGHVMGRATTKQLVYRCPEHHSGARCPAPAAIGCHLLEPHVESAALEALAQLDVRASTGKDVERARLALAAAESELAAYVEATSAAANMEAFAAGAKQRADAVEATREELRMELARQVDVPAAMTGAKAWEGLNAAERNATLRALLSAVVVRRGGGRGSRTPLGERVRILKWGSREFPVRAAGRATGVAPIALPDPDDPDVLRAPG